MLILADDMGCGDVSCLHPEGKIRTEHLDRMADAGMVFTDAHGSSAVCTPSRYSILTGRYAWRGRLQRSVLGPHDGPLLEADRPTLPGFLRAHGYRTACIGKWHLGMEWTFDPAAPRPGGGWQTDAAREASLAIDYTRPLRGGPVDRGFDTYFGVDVPNFPPYTWFENDRLTDVPTVEKPDSMYGNPGKMVPGWALEKMIPEFTRRAVDLVESQADADEPFFLYFPLTSPHSPIVPNEPFRGMSDAGNYGDFVCEVDWVVGQVYDALERTGQLDNMLLFFTSDNGPEGRTPDDLGAYERIRESDHYSMGELRGIKRDAWEGGHRTPFLACWPDVIPAGTVCEQPVCLVDLMATFAEITGADMAKDAGEDSVSILPLLRGEVDRPTRRTVIHHSVSGKV
ncbi:MAG: sulfatase family protein, partial [Planctomycetota bacterium]